MLSLNKDYSWPLTVRPLVPLAAAPPAEISAAVGRRLLRQIQEIRERKVTNPQQCHALHVDDKYLELLGPRLTLSEGATEDFPKILAAISADLHEQGYDYRIKKHAPATGNQFYPCGQALVYDLAAYHASSDRARAGHHNDAGQKSIFYLRCEELIGDETLFMGNLQVDDKFPARWKDPALGRLLLRRSNIELRVVHEALRHAARSEKKNILLATGAANAHMQQMGGVTAVKITAANWEGYAATHRARVARFAALTPGANLGITEDGRHEIILLEQDSVRQLLWRREILRRHMTTNLLALIYYRDAQHNKYKITVPAAAPGLIEAGWRAARRQESAGVTDSLARIFPGKRPEQKFQLRELFPPGAEKNLSLTDYMQRLQGYLQNSGYAAHFLEQHPHVREFVAGPQRHYLAPEFEEGLRRCTDDYFTPPCLGKVYYTATGRGDYLNEQAARLYRWYEHDLPKLVQKFGFSVSKVRAATGGREFPVWKISGDWAEFARRPLPVF